jgi:hypothetical protein
MDTLGEHGVAKRTNLTQRIEEATECDVCLSEEAPVPRAQPARGGGAGAGEAGEGGVKTDLTRWVCDNDAPPCGNVNMYRGVRLGGRWCVGDGEVCVCVCVCVCAEDAERRHECIVGGGGGELVEEVGVEGGMCECTDEDDCV